MRGLCSGLLIVAMVSTSAAAQPIYSPKDAAAYKPRVGKYGGTLTLSTIADPKSFNAIMAKETSTTAITGHIFEGLTRTHGISGEVEPNLAESWDISKDGQTYTFHLRKNAAWSDGRPFTSADVAFTFNRLINNDKVPNSARDILTIEGKFPKVTAVDPHTVEFSLPTRFAPFLRAMSQEILPKHKLEKSVNAGEFAAAWALDTPLSEIVGTGPFMLRKYEPAQRVILVRNPRYWRRDAAGNRLPYIERLIYVVVQSQDVGLLRFQSGVTDVYRLRGTDYPILKPKEKARNYTVYRLGPAYGTNFICFNQHRGTNPKTGKPFVSSEKLSWFTNLKFRQAVAYALNRRQMIAIAMNGLGYPQSAAMSPRAGYFYNDHVKRYVYNPKKARQLLAAAGFTDRNGDGFVEDAQARPVKFIILTNAGNTVREKLLGIIATDLRRIGLDARTALLEFNVLCTKLDATNDWDAILLGLTGGPEPHNGKNVWQSSGQLHMWYPKQKKPATAWEARIDRIFDLGVQELDRKKRKALYDEWQAIVAEQVPFTYTVLSESITAVRNRFGNLAPATYGGVLHNIEELYIVK